MLLESLNSYKNLSWLMADGVIEELELLSAITFIKM